MRLRRAADLLVLLPSGLALASCSSGSAPRQASSPPPAALSYAAGSGSAANGPAGPVDVAKVCGSDTDTYLAELLHHPPTELKVVNEWGDINGGQEVLVAGTTETVHLGPGDLPVDHPMGDDLSLDVKLDPAFRAFSQKLGKAHSDTAPGSMHVEITSGLIPHIPRTSSPPVGESWRQAADFNLAGFQPGFDKPAVGDPILVGGRYIVDCGHPDFHTELHPINFLAWSHRSGHTTTVHFYENGYRDTQYYTADASLIGKVSDPGRLTPPAGQTFPPYFIAQVAGLVSGTVQRLHTFEMVDAATPPSVSFQACPSSSSGKATVNYDIRSRPGVTVRVGSGGGGPCATLQVGVGPTLSEPDFPTRTCVMNWDYLTQMADVSLGTAIDTRTMVKRYLPQKYWPAVDRDPLTGCADALSGPAVSATPSGRTSTSDGSQPFPVYGVVTLRNG